MENDPYDISEDLSVSSADVGWNQLVFQQLRWCNYFKTIARSTFSYAERLRAVNVLEDSIKTIENMLASYKGENEEDSQTEAIKEISEDIISPEEKEELSSIRSEAEVEAMLENRKKELLLNERLKLLDKRHQKLYGLIFKMKLSPEKSQNSEIEGV